MNIIALVQHPLVAVGPIKHQEVGDGFLLCYRHLFDFFLLVILEMTYNFYNKELKIQKVK